MLNSILGPFQLSKTLMSLLCMCLQNPNIEAVANFA